MAKNSDKKNDNPRKKFRSDILMALFLLALLAFMAYNAMNYVNWAQEKKVENPDTGPRPVRK